MQQSSDVPVDMAELLERIEGDLELLDDMVEIFASVIDRIGASVNDALNRGDGPAIATAAHELKGMLANLSAHHGTELSARTEKAALEGDLHTVGLLWIDLVAETGRIQTYLEKKRR